MELTKETIRSIPLAKLRKFYHLLAEELSGITYDAYLDVLEKLEVCMGSDARVNMSTGVLDSQLLTIQSNILTDTFDNLAKEVKYAYEQHGFSVDFEYQASCAPTGTSYTVTIHHLPVELSWLDVEKDIPLKTIIRKLRK